MIEIRALREDDDRSQFHSGDPDLDRFFHKFAGQNQFRRYGKAEVRIFDYVDRGVPMLLRMFAKRLRGYRAIGYARGEAPLGYADPADEVTVERDEDVLRSLKALDDFA